MDIKLTSIFPTHSSSWPRCSVMFCQSLALLENGLLIHCRHVRIPILRLSQSLCTFYSVKNAPEFLPGTKFKSKAREMSKDIDEFCEKPFRFVKNSLVVRILHDYTLRLRSCMQEHGTAIDSFTSELLLDSTDIDEDTVKDVSSTLYAGGADTVSFGLLGTSNAYTLPGCRRLLQHLGRFS